MNPDPMKYAILGLPRSMTFRLSEMFGFVHEPSTMDEKERSLLSWKYDGFCDTTVHRAYELIDKSTRIVVVRRKMEDVQNSIKRIFPEISRPAIGSIVFGLKCDLGRFLIGRPHLSIPYPVTDDSLRTIEAHLGIFANDRDCEIRSDATNDPEYKAKCLDALKIVDQGKDRHEYILHRSALAQNLGTGESDRND